MRVHAFIYCHTFEKEMRSTAQDYACAAAKWLQNRHLSELLTGCE
jgi:hypothetical protein